MKYLVAIAGLSGAVVVCVLLAVFCGFLSGAFISGCSRGVNILPPPAAAGPSATEAVPHRNR